MATLSSQKTPPVSRPGTIQKLRAGLCRLQQDLRLMPREGFAVSTGVPALDSILPDRGLRRGTLSEWIAAEAGCGATWLAMSIAGRAAGHSAEKRISAEKRASAEEPLMIIDREKRFYAPAFQRAGVCPEKIVLIRPDSRRDELWAVEQSLRCPGIAAVVCQIDRLKTQEFRRLQLAAEAGTAIGFLIRPPDARKNPGWANVRLLVSARPSQPQSFRRRMEVRCLYAKGGLADQTVQLDICDGTGAVSLAAKFSPSANPVRAAGA